MPATARAATRASGCYAARRCWRARTTSTATTSTPTTWRAPASRRCTGRGRSACFNVCDNSELLIGDYYDLAADLCGLPRPPRLTRAEAEVRLSAQQMSFLSESRRLDNRRLREELRLALRYPTVREGLLRG